MFFYFLIEVIAFAWLDFVLLPKDFLVDLIFVLFVASVVFIIPSNLISWIYVSFWLILLNIVFLVNANIYTGYYELFTLQQFKLIGEATDILNLDYVFIETFLPFFGVLIVYFILIKVLKRRFLSVRPRPSIKTFVGSLFIFLIVTFSLLFLLSADRIKPFSLYNSDLNSTTLRRSSMEKYGLLPYYFKEADLLYFSDVNEEYQTPSEEHVSSEFNGLLSGYNIFTILIESAQAYTVHPVLTPNLYKMTQEGLFFPNHYSENKSNVSELIGIVGHYPTQSFVPEDYNYNFESSLPKILRPEYETAFFHDNNDTFYSRKTLYPMVGFEHLYFHDQIFPETPRWEWSVGMPLDSETATQMLPLLNITDKPFYYYWATLLTHGPYNESEKNSQIFEDFGYYDLIEQEEEKGTWVNPLIEYDQEDQDRMKFYQAGMMDFDKALGIIMDDLAAKGKLDKTLFILYGDHSPYYYHLNKKVVMSPDEDFAHYYMDYYKSFFTIYNEDLTNAYLNAGHSDNIIEKFVSPYAIVPTVYDLLGIDYNNVFMLSDHVFSQKHEIFYTNKTTAFFDNLIYSDDGETITYQKELVSPDYYEYFTGEAQKIINKINLINEYYLNTRVPVN
jgi:lipoteichoic acid synthase